MPKAVQTSESEVKFVTGENCREAAGVLLPAAGVLLPNAGPPSMGPCTIEGWLVLLRDVGTRKRPGLGSRDWDSLSREDLARAPGREKSDRGVPIEHL